MIASLQCAEESLRHTRYLGVGPRPLYLLPLLRLGGLSASLTREAADSGWAEEFGAEMISLEQQTGARGAEVLAGRHDLDELLSRLPALVGSRWHGREFSLASYGRFRGRWMAAFEKVGARLVVPTRRATSVVPRDKAAMRDWLRQLGVPTPASTVIDGDLEYPMLRRRFGRDFVVQTPNGSGGKGTYLIADEDAVRSLPVAPRWLVSEYAGDITLNFHGFVAGDSTVAVLRPSVQLTDVVVSGSGFGKYAGSDFQAPMHLSGVVLARGHDAMQRIGRGLGDLGYRGVFGVDFAVRDDTVSALEINARLQGSTWLLGETELAAGEMPTMVRHVLERHDNATRATPDLAPAAGAQLSIRHSGSPGRLLHGPTGGVYRLEGDQLRWRAEGRGLLECGPQDCVLANVPQPGTLLHPDAILARLVTRNSLTSPDGKAITGYGRRVIDAVHRLFSCEQHDSPPPEHHAAGQDPPAIRSGWGRGRPPPNLVR
jgi:hypothetical protein